MKHRKYPKVSEEVVEQKIKRLQIEEQNMKILRFPYLTLDQSWGHSQELGKGKSYIRHLYTSQRENKAKPDVTLEEQYNMLKVKDVWD